MWTAGTRRQRGSMARQLTVGQGAFVGRGSSKLKEGGAFGAGSKETFLVGKGE